jgi:poly-gamma-glutamate synthesis protein (capsule biosynthesis protein)
MNSIIIVGDLFPTKENSSFFSKGDVKSLFGDRLCGMFANADFSICNLEGALADYPDECQKTGPIKLAPTSSVNAYKELGIKCCMLANNHVSDGGQQGIVETMSILDKANIKSIGAGINADCIVHFYIQEVGGVRFGFYNVGETMYNKPTKDKAGVWLYDEYIVCKELEQLKQNCDFLIVIYHGGIEKFQYPSPEIRKRFHRMADCGADMILSQHTHCVGCEEWYNGSYLLYGQGDFLLNNFAPGMTDSGLVIEIDIEDRQVQIKKHLVNSFENKFVRYSEQQDLHAFSERSKLVTDDEFVFCQFQKFCEGELNLYLSSFKSPTKVIRGIKRCFPKVYNKWLFRYNERDLLFTLHTLRSEQNRETAIVGLEHLLEKE